MSRLVVFGCSHAYGLGLPDCTTIHTGPSQLGFANILGKKLGMSVVNYADTGASQKEITATILESELQNTDVVVINWSNPYRRSIWNGIHWEQLARWNNDKTWQKFFTKYHRREDDILDTLMNVNLANYYLQNKVKTVINSLHDFDNEIFNAEKKWNTVKFNITFSPTDNSIYYKELPCGHPDLKSHDVFAERLFGLINNV
jgi:hypothetical protein